MTRPIETPATRTPAPIAARVTTTPDDRPDTRDMVFVHTGFRRELRLMPGLVHAVADGDRERAEVVSAHLELWLDAPARPPHT